jgi:hypothetical protein
MGDLARVDVHAGENGQDTRLLGAHMRRRVDLFYHSLLASRNMNLNLKDSLRAIARERLRDLLMTSPASADGKARRSYT